MVASSLSVAHTVPFSVSVHACVSFGLVYMQKLRFPVLLCVLTVALGSNTIVKDVSELRVIERALL